jgi:hypothetical protein
MMGNPFFTILSLQLQAVQQYLAFVQSLMVPWVPEPVRVSTSTTLVPVHRPYDQRP